ncbi:MAG: toxin-activating lysine-acyltransferase [Alphaproteobacteria bacterium]|nr:toxin-activating lysine-acyltransferase [Alphaproteobacteria bacterium]
MSGKASSKNKSAKPTQLPAKSNLAAAQASEQPSTTVTDAGLKPEAPTQQRQPNGPAEVLGDVVWLMSHSPGHKHLFISDMDWLVMPPVMHKQFRLFKDGDKPFAFVTWALLDEEAEKRILSGQVRLRPTDWRSGSKLWLIDIVAPFGGQDGVLKHLKQTLFKDQPLLALRPGENGQGYVAGEVKVTEKTMGKTES